MNTELIVQKIYTYNYPIDRIKEQEDRLKVAQKLLDERLEEKNSLQKIKKE